MDKVDKARLQKAIDVNFSIAMMLYYALQGTATNRAEENVSSVFKGMSREECMEWVAEQLRACGFDTQPCGASWGVLK